MKILVTGANGYLGQGIIKSLSDRGLDVIATDFKCDYVDKRAQSIACNLFEIDNPYDFFGHPDVVLHLAWREGFVHYSNVHIEVYLDSFPHQNKHLEQIHQKAVLLRFLAYLQYVKLDRLPLFFL